MCKLFYVLKINYQENALLNIISHSANTTFVIIRDVSVSEEHLFLLRLE